MIPRATPPLPPRSLRLFDISFATDLDFALPPSASSTPAFTIFESAAPVIPESPCEEVFKWETESGVTWLEVTSTASDYFLHFPGYANVRVSRDAKRVVFHREPGIPWMTLEHLLLDQAIPLVLSLAGKFVLHCSAVASPAGALVFSGKAGQGKSTLAAAFALRGFPLLTDDSLLLRPEGRAIMSYPSYPSLRLWPEDTRHFEQLGGEISEVAHYTSKKRLRLDTGRGSFAERPVKTAALYLLANATGAEGRPLRQDRPRSRGNAPVSIVKLSAREAFMELVQNSLHMDPAGRVSLKAQTERMAVLANAIPAFRLSYPHEHALLPNVVEKVLAHAASLEPLHLHQETATGTGRMPVLLTEAPCP